MKEHAFEKLPAMMAAVSSFATVHEATRFNRGDAGTLGDWSTVKGSIFDRNGTTNTLSLAAFPEPTAATLFATFLAIGLAARRRCCRA